MTPVAVVSWRDRNASSVRATTSTMALPNMSKRVLIRVFSLRYFPSALGGGGVGEVEASPASP